MLALLLMGAIDSSVRLALILDHVVTKAVHDLGVERIWLFGSRSRDAATRASDVDLALKLPAGSRRHWARFVLETEESLPALAELDLVDIEGCPPELAAEVIRTGRIVYERVAP